MTPPLVRKSLFFLPLVVPLSGSDQKCDIEQGPGQPSPDASRALS
jgi:hypothetical protein